MLRTFVNRVPLSLSQGFRLQCLRQFRYLSSPFVQRQQKQLYRGFKKPKYSAQWVEEIPDVQFNPEDLASSTGVVNKIVNELRKQEQYFILPKDDVLFTELVAPIGELLATGVKPEFIISACIARTNLFALLTRSGRRTIEIIKILVSMCGLSYEDSLRVMASYGDELLAVKTAGVISRIDAVTYATGAEHVAEIGNVVRFCPAVLFASEPQQMLQVAEAMLGFFSKKQVSRIVSHNPAALLLPIEELEAKYDYIYFHMGVEPEDFEGCFKWIELSLQDIIIRHRVLVKAGKYHMPSEKKPHLKIQNPELHRILDSTDEHFSSKIAGISLEEWTIFKAIEQKTIDESDQDRPFTKMKPSLRKAAERQRKEAQRLGEHVFDVNAAKIDD